MAWSSGVIGGVAAAIIVPLVSWFINRRAPGAAQRTNLRQSWFAIGMYIFGIAFFGWMFFLSAYLVPRDERNPWWATLGFVAFLLAFCWGLVDGMLRRVAWSDTGVTLRRFHRIRLLRWDEIGPIVYKPFLQFWRIGLPESAGFGIWPMTVGLADFLEEARRRGVRVRGQP